MIYSFIHLLITLKVHPKVHVGEEGHADQVDFVYNYP